jgi:hypothetical protein
MLLAASCVLISLAGCPPARAEHAARELAAEQPGALSDPTQPTPQMLDLLRGAAGRDLRREALKHIPRIEIKARIIAAQKPPLAMLSVGGENHVASPGGVLTWSGKEGTLRIRVMEITADEVVINIESLNQTVVVQ